MALRGASCGPLLWALKWRSKAGLRVGYLGKGEICGKSRFEEALQRGDRREA